MVKSLRRGAVRAGDTVVIVGAGIMGQLHVVLAAHAGARVIVADRVQFRLSRARELGAEHAIDVDQTDLSKAVAEITGGAMADVVVVGPGSIEAMEAGLACAGPASRVVMFTTTMAPEAVIAMTMEDREAVIAAWTERGTLKQLASGVDQVPVTKTVVGRR